MRLPSSGLAQGRCRSTQFVPTKLMILQQNRSLLFLALVHCLSSVWLAPVARAQDSASFKVRSAPFVRMPGAREFGEPWGVDGNSPAERTATGGLLIFNSLQYPWRSEGANLFAMQESERVVIRDREALEGGLWLEATYRDADGTLFGWVHNEVDPNCENEFLKVPQIRQMISHDDGRTWEDVGLLLAAPSNTYRCDTANMYFAGGNGDLSVCFDQASGYFYFYYTTYSREFSEQGIGSARLKYSDRFNPSGKVWRWNGGGWNEPGIGGHGAVIFPPASDWHFTDADAYWGPAVHYNTYLRQYVMLLNHRHQRSLGD